MCWHIHPSLHLASVDREIRAIAGQGWEGQAPTVSATRPSGPSRVTRVTWYVLTPLSGRATPTPTPTPRLAAPRPQRLCPTWPLPARPLGPCVTCPPTPGTGKAQAARRILPACRPRPPGSPPRLPAPTRGSTTAQTAHAGRAGEVAGQG